MILAAFNNLVTIPGFTRKREGEREREKENSLKIQKKLFD